MGKSANLKIGVIRKQSMPNVCFLENLACFIFLWDPLCDSPFCLIANELYSLIEYCWAREVLQLVTWLFLHSFFVMFPFHFFFCDISTTGNPRGVFYLFWSIFKVTRHCLARKLFEITCPVVFHLKSGIEKCQCLKL